MIAFPNCKINLGLNILRKRADGFHDLETIFYPLPLHDAVEIITADPHEQNIDHTTSGLTINGNKEGDLCIKAYRLLKKDHPGMPAIKMHLHKAIPMGAGLGGGSADAAFVLKLLNDKYRLALSADQLLGYAAMLGSDVPFFIGNTPCFAGGRGEVLQPADVDLSMYDIALINPGIHIDTGRAFSQLVPAMPRRSVAQIIQQPITTWKDELHNDFEVSIFKAHPEIKDIKEKLYSSGALYAAMSGSGSSVYGIFQKGDISLDLPENYFYKLV